MERSTPAPRVAAAAAPYALASRGQTHTRTPLPPPAHRRRSATIRAPRHPSRTPVHTAPQTQAARNAHLHPQRTASQRVLFPRNCQRKRKHPCRRDQGRPPQHPRRPPVTVQRHRAYLLPNAAQNLCSHPPGRSGDPVASSTNTTPEPGVTLPIRVTATPPSRLGTRTVGPAANSSS